MKVDILAFQEWGKLTMIMNVMYGKCDVPLALQPESSVLSLYLSVIQVVYVIYSWVFE